MIKRCEICGDLFDTGEGSGKWQRKMCDRDHMFRCSICGELVKIKTIKKIYIPVKYRVNDQIILPFHVSYIDNDRCILEFIEKTCNKCSHKIGQSHLELTNLDRYGIRSLLSLPEVRAKTYEALASEETKQKRINTNQERYNVDSYLELVWQKGNKASHSKKAEEKRAETFFNNYGTKHPMQNEEIKNKVKNTNLLIYGYENPFQSKAVQDRFKETCLERYGYEHHMSSPDVLDRYIRKRKEKFGDEDPFLCSNSSRISNLNKEIAKMFEENGLEVGFEKKVGGYFYDLIIKDNILIEINPTISHNSTISFKELVYGIESSPLPEDYHIKKAINARDNGYILFHIWNWTNKEKLVNNIISYINNEPLPEIEFEEIVDWNIFSLYNLEPIEFMNIKYEEKIGSKIVDVYLPCVRNEGERQ